MKISLKAIEKLNAKYGNGDNPAADGVDELVRKIGAQLGEVEEVVDLGKKYQGIVVAKVVTCDKHPNADKLSLCTIDDGGVTANVARNEKGHVQVVCGAPNVRAGLTVAWLPPGATVPSTYDKDPFVLEAREIRGQVSHGMLASPRELALSDTHDGILELDDKFTAGTMLTEALALDDHIIEVENKMFTHRPDCFGLLGVARELAGIRHKAYQSPDWYKKPLELQKVSDDLPLEVRNEAGALVPRFMAVAIKDVEVRPSPVWLQTFLGKMGLKPINNIVDLTNYYMLLTAQPLHAYDYDKVKAKSGGNKAVLVSRLAAKEERLFLLNGKTVAFEDPAVLIATDKEPIGLGGIMGGSETEVDESTKNIILECANFDMYNIRRTSMKYGLFTDAATRYTKGQSPLQNDRVLARIAQDITEQAGGLIASDLLDVHNELAAPAAVTVTAQFVNERLGLALDDNALAELLRNVEFDVQISNGNLSFTPPFWRTDIEIPEDIVEEVGRLYGFDHLPKVLPIKDLTPARVDAMLAFKHRLRGLLARSGANEILTYSFVHQKLLEAAGQDPEKAFHIRNAISPELQYYRLSLLPSVLEKVQINIRSDLVRPTGDNEFAIYEINKVHIKGVDAPDEPVPYEYMKLALVFAADDKTAARKYSGAPYYQARQFLDYLLHALNIGVEYHSLEPEKYQGEFSQQIGLYQSGRSASVMAGEVVVGQIGEFNTKIRRSLKLPAFTAGFELDVEALLRLTTERPYQPLSKFPKTEQDICLRVGVGTAYAQVRQCVQDSLAEASNEHGYTFEVLPLDIYQGAKDTAHKQITFRIWLSHFERTLTTEEVNRLLQGIADTAAKQLQATRV